ncbi:glutathione S-transferase C-terminal domain-containing protein [Marilutibacter maris]|uniref:Glutathione S-transferase n=1 Tax=Marilutibacter maris TaxID=1605891 RepID=A0A2U9TD42_9GAMM|nr:glutathione S-transferase C-terminal domain-containing protein [Lysobacter maris]AWV08784.1 glutathione S-transferase [Lysobacter maris]
MIDLYYWPTPNGHKITLFLEEAGLDYTVHPVDIGAGDQFKPEFLAFSPNNKMPAIIDNAPADGGLPITVFESGAILVYLANKTGKFFGADVRQKVEVNQWLMWQMAGLGPMTGQYGHFNVYAPEPIPYAIDRYTREVQRLLGVLDKRLDGRDFIAGPQYTIADMACYPWIDPYDKAPMDLSDYPNLRRWRSAIAERPGTVRAYEVADRHRVQREMTEEMRRNLFGTPAKVD